MYYLNNSCMSIIITCNTAANRLAIGSGQWSMYTPTHIATLYDHDRKPIYIISSTISLFYPKP